MDVGDFCARRPPLLGGAVARRHIAAVGQELVGLGTAQLFWMGAFQTDAKPTQFLPSDLMMDKKRSLIKHAWKPTPAH